MGQTMKCESEEDAKEPEAENEKPRLAHSELETMTEEQVEFYQISPIAHIILDESHRIIEANEAAARVFHTELEHIVSCQMLRFIAQKSYRDFVRHLSRVQKKGSDSTDLVMGRYGEPSFRAHVVTHSTTKGGGIQGYHMVIEDFTERKRIEQALKSSEEQFRKAIEDAPIPIIMQAEDGEVLQISHSWTELTGYSINDLRSFDEWVTKAVYGEGANKVRDHLHELFKGNRRSIDIEFAIRSAKGEERHWSFSASSLGTLRDGRRFIVGMAVDVTERKKAEEAIKESEELYRMLFENSEDGFQIIEPMLDGNGKVSDFRYLRVNEAFEKQSGLKVSDVIGKRVKEVLPEVEASWLERYDVVLKSELPEHFEDYNTDTEKWYDMLVFLYSKGQIGALFRDITERKRAEEAIKESEHLYRTLFENTEDGFQIVEPILDEQGNVYDFRYLAVNAAFERQTGVKGSEIIGRTAKQVFPTMEQYWIDMYGKVLEEKKPQHYADYFDSVQRWYDLFYFPFPDGKIGVLFRDISDRKKAEKELKRSNEELQRFAHIASHDLREPLRMISSYLGLLEKKYQGKLDEKADEYIGFAVDGAERMQQLIDDLLAYSRVETKGKEFTDVDMNEVLATVLNDLRKSIEETGASITDDHLPAVLADRAQMILLLENIIGNSIKFRDVAAPQIHVSSESKEADWVFSVKDNGIGISLEYHEKIFEVFQRLHTKEEYEGTGIGLAVAKKIVERHGGRIWVESEEGKGSTFYFTIPKVMR